MPTNPSKQVRQVAELPPGVTQDQFQTLMNDRIQELNQHLGNFVQNPALGDVDLGTNRGVNCADPKNDLDVVNLRTLKKFGNQAAPTQVATGSGLERPTIYFTFDGFPFDGEQSPFAMIMANRAGFSPVAVSISAVIGGITQPVRGNLLIKGVPMLLDDIELPAGAQGPVFSSALRLGGSLALGTLIQGVITLASGASQVTLGLAIAGGG